MFLVCTWYVLGTYWYILGKTKKRMRIMLGFDPWISCIAYRAQYRYATSVHCIVISLVNTRYIFSKSTLAWHSTGRVWPWRPARVPPRPRLWPWRHWSRHDRLEFNVGSARDRPWKLKLVAIHSLPVESRLKGEPKLFSQWVVQVIVLSEIFDSSMKEFVTGLSEII